VEIEPARPLDDRRKRPTFVLDGPAIEDQHTMDVTLSTDRPGSGLGAVNSIENGYGQGLLTSWRYRVWIPASIRRHCSS
jgi:hypothetical protein